MTTQKIFAQEITPHKIIVQDITPEAFRPYGQLIGAIADGKTFDAEDAQLHLHNGTPRFYIMRLQNRGRRFHHITRHQRCTQCLGAIGGPEWLLAVAVPDDAPHPNLETLKVFRIAGHCFVKLELGTWHAGPYFDAAAIEFYNLELSDTNLTDHDTCNLREAFGIEFEIVESSLINSDSDSF